MALKEGGRRCVFAEDPQYRKLYFEVFTTQGQHPTSWWGIKDAEDDEVLQQADGTTRRHGIIRKYAAELKGFFVHVTSQATLPKAPRVLNLRQPILVVQAFVPSAASGFRCTLSVKIGDGSEVQLFLSSLLKRKVVTSTLRVSLPLALQTSTWQYVVFDLPHLLQSCFPGAAFVSLDRITLEPSCRVRKIFTMQHLPTEDTFMPSASSHQPVPHVSSRRVRGSGALWSSDQHSDEDEDAQDDAGEADEHACNITLPPSLLFPPECVFSTVLVGEERAEEDSHRAGLPTTADTWKAPREERLLEVGVLRKREKDDDVDDDQMSEYTLYSEDSDLSLGRAGLYSLEPDDCPLLHCDNVRLFAAKKRSDAKLQAMEAELQHIKRDTAPQIEEAWRNARRAEELSAQAELSRHETWTLLQREQQLRRQLEQELELERALNIDFRVQVRNLQALLVRSKRKTEFVAQELTDLRHIHKPFEQKRKSEVETLKEKVKSLEQKSSSLGQTTQSVAQTLEEKTKEVAALSAEVSSERAKLQHEEGIRVNMMAEHSEKARAWAAEVAELKSSLRLRDAQIEDLRQRLVSGEVAQRMAAAAQEEASHVHQELEGVRAGAGRAERELALARVEMARLHKTLASAQSDKEAAIERMEREQAVAFAKFQLSHQQQLESLRERAEGAERRLRLLHLKSRPGPPGAMVLFDREVEGASSQLHDSLTTAGLAAQASLG